MSAHNMSASKAVKVFSLGSNAVSSGQSGSTFPERAARFCS